MFHRSGFRIVPFFLFWFALFSAEAQERIAGPWTWLAVKGDGYVDYDHLDVDWLEKRTGLKESELVGSGIATGTKAGTQVWREGSLSGSADNLHELARAAGFIGKANVWSWYWYGVAVVESGRDQARVTMRTGSDDGIKVWLNGEQVHRFNGFRTASTFLNEFSVDLKKGRNLLVVKVFQGTDTWSFHGGIQADFRIGAKTYRPGPDPELPVRSDPADAALAEAIGLIKKNATAGELRLAFDRVEALAPNNGYYAYERGYQLLWKKYDYTESRTAFLRGLAKGYRTANLLAYLSLACRDSDTLKEAVDYAEQSVALIRQETVEGVQNDDVSFAWSVLVEAYREAEKYQAALDAAAAALKAGVPPGYRRLVEAETSTHIHMAYQALQENRFSAALDCLRRADASAARNADFIKDGYPGWGRDRLALLAKKRLAGEVSQHVLRIRGMWVMHTAVHHDLRGVRLDVENSISESEMRKGLQAQTYLKYWFEAASGGIYSLQFDNSYLESTVETVEYFGPVITPIPGKIPGMGALLLEEAADTDVFVLYWPAAGLSSGMGVGGAWSPSIDAAGRKLGVLRGMIQMSSREASWNTAGLLKHEFMHVIEILIHDGFAHTFGEERQALFPDWKGSLSDQDSFYYWYIANKLKLPWGELDYTKRYPDLEALVRKHAGNTKPLVDAGFNAGDGSLYLFQDRSYLRFDIATDKVMDGYPRDIASDWNLPWSGAPDASFPSSDGTGVWMTKGSSVVLLDIATRKITEGYPKTIAELWPGIWPQGIDSAIAWGDGYLYFFRDGDYMAWDIGKSRLYSPTARRIAEGWKGVDFDRLDEVLNIGSKFYFFRINDYIRYDRGGGKALSGYPRPVVSNWTGVLPY